MALGTITGQRIHYRISNWNPNREKEIRSYCDIAGIELRVCAGTVIVSNPENNDLTDRQEETLKKLRLNFLLVAISET